MQHPADIGAVVHESLLADVVLGGPAPVIMGLLSAAVITGLWFALPLVKRGD